MAATSSNAGAQSSDPYKWEELGEEEEAEAYSLAFNLRCDGDVKLGVLKAVIELGILEMIKECGPLSAAEMAAKLPTGDPERAAASLRRLLDCTVTYAVLTFSLLTLPDGTVERRYDLAPAARFYTRNEDGVSLAPFFLDPLCRSVFESSLHLKDAVLEGSKPYTKAHKMSFYEHSGRDPEHAKAFNEAMSNQTTMIMRKILRTYKGFEGLSSLVDVGGGNGTSLSMIVSHFPSIKGINFDQPHVVANAPSYPGVEHVGGDLFAGSIPRGDAIFLKWILHGFDDEMCIKILKNCYAALPEGCGKLIVCEYHLPNDDDSSNGINANAVVEFDVIMMVMGSGKERREKEFEALALAAEFRSIRVACSVYNVKVMEFLK